MLDVLAVLGDEGRRQLDELGSQLRDQLGPDGVLDWLLLFGVGVDVDFELSCPFSYQYARLRHSSDC